MFHHSCTALTLLGWPQKLLVSSREMKNQLFTILGLIPVLFPSSREAQGKALLDMNYPAQKGEFLNTTGSMTTQDGE